MKKLIKPLALFTMLSAIMTGCQKENDIYSCNPSEGCDLSIITHSTRMGNTITFGSTINLDTMEQSIKRLVESGYTVVVKQNNTVSTKEKLTYSSYNWDDAYDWYKQKKSEGYSVSIVQDKTTGEYICTAEK